MHEMPSHSSSGTMVACGLLLLLCGLSCGCQSTGSTTRRAAVVALGSAAGAGLGHELGNGSARDTALGAVAGAALTHLALGKDPAVERQGFDAGYVQGQSDAIKRQYFLRLEAQRVPPQPRPRGRVRTYFVPGPSKLPDGTALAPHLLPVRVTE